MHKGFTALISAIIISVILLGLAVALSGSTFFARFNALNREYKRISLGLAEACVHRALAKISLDYDYVVPSGGETVPLDPVYGRDTECVIEGPTTAPTEVAGKKQFAIRTSASYAGAFSSLSVSASAQDPEEAPVVPPPNCTLTSAPSSVPLGQSVTLLWSATANADSMTIDHGVGSVNPLTTSGPWKTVVPGSTGEFTYVASVSNEGGTNTCETTFTVTAPPPAPACADTVMILDRTGSMSGTDLSNERNAANTLVNLYAGAQGSPKVGAGSFGAYPNAAIPSGAASVPTNGQLTSIYSTITSLISQLTGSTSSVGSNLGRAIEVGATELGSARHVATKEKVLIFVSDGVPNEPTSGSQGNTALLSPTANTQNGGGDAWTNPAGAYGTGAATDAGGHRHRFSSFNFSIPSNASITGITVETSARSNNTAPTTLFTDSFGTGSSLNDIPSWEEEGTENDSTTLALAPGSGNDTASPDGGRFARIGQDEWVCRAANATGLTSLSLSFYWRGDSDAESSDMMYVEYNTNGDCNTSTGWTAIASDNLNGFTGSWSGRQTVGLPASLNNDSSFSVRFRVDSNNSNEELRVDGVTLATNPPVCQLGADLSWNGGSSWSSEKIVALTSATTTSVYGSNTDEWGHNWTVSELSNTNFRVRIHATPTNASCVVDSLAARVYYTIPTDPTQYTRDAASNAKDDGVTIFAIHYGDSAGQSLMGEIASNSSIPSSTITSATRASGSATITTAVPHRLAPNQRVRISGVSNSTYNGTFTVTAVPSPTTFRYALSGSGNATGGTAVPTNLFIAPASSAISGIFQSIGYQVCPAAAAACSNTIDDDGDGLIDSSDGGCHTDEDETNPGSYDPDDGDEWETPGIATPPPPPPPPPNISIGSWIET